MEGELQLTLRDAMLRLSIAAFLLVGACSVASYPRYEVVVRDPKDFDLLYSSTSGPHNETWYLSSAVNLTSIIIPSQIFNLWSSGPWTNGTYMEEVVLRLYETKLASPSSLEQTFLVASGAFTGAVSFGQEVAITLKNATLNGAPQLQRYINSYTGYKYTLNLVFMRNGVYPWYTARALATNTVVHSATSGPGIAIGMSYTVR